MQKKSSKIEVNSISLKRDEKVVLKDICLTLTKKRIGIIGQNGSGKSSFARVLCGLLEPAAGRVIINGVDVHKARKDALSMIGIIFQNPDHQIIFPTVEEEMAFGFEQLGHGKLEAREQAKLVLKNFGKSDWAAKQCHSLSQGQRHFLCLMAVLAMAPKVILLDEPYAGLDMATSLVLHHEINKLEQQVLLISHDLEVMKDYDELIWFDGGRVIAQDKPKALIPRYIEEMIKRSKQNVGA